MQAEAGHGSARPERELRSGTAIDWSDKPSRNTLQSLNPELQITPRLEWTDVSRVLSHLIIAPTLLKPEVWHELIRVVKIKRFK